MLRVALSEKRGRKDLIENHELFATIGQYGNSKAP
jgi:hypothetical protein